MNLRLFSSTHWLFTTLALLLAGQAIPAGAQLVTRPTWRKVGLEARTAHAMVFDERRGRLVLFGGMGAACALGDTWEYDGTTWLACPGAAAPAARYGHAMAYDSDRGVVVLFGGVPNSGPSMNDTWEWDGAVWTRRTPATSPSSRSYHAMAYDRARKRVVLFGGFGPTGSSTGDTWEWDGTNWTQRMPTTVPPARAITAMAYDSTRQRTVMFGGISNSGGPNDRDTWEWDGTTWTRFTPALSPPGSDYNSSVCMAFDSQRSRTVLCVGNQSVAGSVWEWDGAAWSHKASALPAIAREQALAFDTVRGRALLFGGSRGLYQHDLTFTPTALWAWDGSAWAQRLASVSIQSYQPRGVFDSARGRAVAMADITTSPSIWWEWDGSSWSQQRASIAPCGRLHHAMAYDRQRKRVVLFGGLSYGSSPALNDTWEYDGKDWTQRTPAVSPPAGSISAAMAYDELRQRTVLYVPLLTMAETWEWNGSAWSKMTTTTSPNLSFAALAWDSARRRLILFGASNNGTLLQSETWAWDGAVWTKLSPAHSPSPRQGAAMAWDEVRGRLVLFGGGSTGSQYYNDVWEWDGTDWTALNIPSPPASRYQATLVYDSARRRFLLFGGSFSTSTALYYTYYQDTWELIFPIPPRTAARDWVNYP